MVHLTRKLVVGASNVTPGGVRTGGLSSLPPIDDFRVLPMGEYLSHLLIHSCLLTYFLSLDNAHGFGSAIKDFNASLYKTHTHALTTHSMASTITTKKREGIYFSYLLLIYLLIYTFIQVMIYCLHGGNPEHINETLVQWQVSLISIPYYVII